MASVTVQLSTAVTGHKTLEDVLWVADLLHRFDFSQARAHTHCICALTAERLQHFCEQNCRCSTWESCLFGAERQRHMYLCVHVSVHGPLLLWRVCVARWHSIRLTRGGCLLVFILPSLSGSTTAPSAFCLNAHATRNKLSQLQELAVQIFR